MVAKSKIKDKTFEPVMEQVEILLEYIELLAKKPNIDKEEEITMLMSIIIHTKNQCLIYLNNEIKKLGNKNGRNYKL